MKIIHLPIEIAGQIGILCGALKRLGHQAVGYNYFHTFLNYKDNILSADAFEILNLFDQAMQHFDLFHFHYSSTFTANYQDIELLAKANKPMVMHHWGNDVRKGSIARQQNPYVNTSDSPPEETIDERLKKLSQYIQTAIVQDYEVYEYVSPYYKNVYVLPVAVELSRFTPVYPNPSEPNPLVIHAPTNPEVKGTAIIEQVISRLQQEIPFRYQRVEKLSHEQATKLYREADIVIDQILFGSYGVLSVESMALGKPVIAYVRNDLLPNYNGRLPICNANPDTLYDVLKELLLSGEKRQQAGIAGRKFAEAEHDSDKVATQLLRIYDQLLG